MENPFLSFLTDSEVMSQHCASSFETNPSASTLSLRAKHVVVADAGQPQDDINCSRWLTGLVERSTFGR